MHAYDFLDKIAGEMHQQSKRCDRTQPRLQSGHFRLQDFEILQLAQELYAA